MSIRFDHGDVDRWVIKLGEALSKVPDEAAKVVEKGAVNIKKDAQRRIGRPKHAPSYSRSITYDMRRAMRGPEAEIGPDKGKRQGALGNILEYGTVKNAPIPHLNPAAEAEAPRFEQAMEDLAASLLEDQ